MKRILLLVLAMIAFAAGLLTAPARGEGKPDGLTARVRGDLLGGAQGDKPALDRATRAIDAALQADAGDAEALALHGALTWMRCGQASQAGDMARAQDLYAQSLDEFDRAVAAAPRSAAVRSTRGMMMLMALPNMPDMVRAEVAERALADYTALDQIAGERPGVHAKGERLLGLAILSDDSGNKTRTEALLKRVVAELSQTPYARVAAAWSAGRAPQRRACLGCHVEAAQ